MLRKIQRIYGKVPEREYAAGDLKNISHYFLRKKGDDFWIDDITWNDLDMDRIYMLINQTVSSPGEDVLYDMLRRPVFRQEDIDRREKLIRFFAENKEKREQMQILLSNVGKTWHGSLSDTILALEEAPQVNTGPVSYTHLDVYKRQGRAYGGTGGKRTDSGSSGNYHVRYGSLRKKDSSSSYERAL